MVSALPRPLDLVFGCLVAASIFVAFLSLFLDTFSELAIAFGITIGILFVTVVPLIFAVRVFQNLFRGLKGVN